MKQLRSAERALHDQKATAEQAQAAAQDEQAQIGKAQAAVEAANAQQENLLSQVNGEIAQLVAEAEAQKEAAALAAAQQRYVDAAAAAARRRPAGPLAGRLAKWNGHQQQPRFERRRQRTCPRPQRQRPGQRRRCGHRDRVSRGRSSASRIATPVPDPGVSTAPASPCRHGVRRA